MSLLVLPGSIGRDSLSILPVGGNPAPSESWYPSGPAMNIVLGEMFTDSTSEFNQMRNGGLDFTDTPLYSNDVSTYSGSSSYYLSSAQEGVVSGIDFNLANTFWGCNMNFSNNACGREIRRSLERKVRETAKISGWYFTGRS
jgi:hypothetical protein